VEDLPKTSSPRGTQVPISADLGLHRDLRLGSGILYRLLLFLFHLSDSLHLVVCRTAKCNATFAGAIVLGTPLHAPFRRPNAT
jgi:hypothetical protein